MNSTWESQVESHIWGLKKITFVLYGDFIFKIFKLKKKHEEDWELDFFFCTSINQFINLLNLFHFLTFLLRELTYRAGYKKKIIALTKSYIYLQLSHS